MNYNTNSNIDSISQAGDLVVLSRDKHADVLAILDVADAGVKLNGKGQSQKMRELHDMAREKLKPIAVLQATR